MKMRLVIILVSICAAFIFLILSISWITDVVIPLYAPEREAMANPNPEPGTISTDFLAVPRHAHVTYYSDRNGHPLYPVKGPIRINVSETHQGWYNDYGTGWLRLSDFTFDPRQVEPVYNASKPELHHTFSFIDVNHDGALDVIHEYYHDHGPLDEGYVTVIYEYHDGQPSGIFFTNTDDRIKRVALRDGTIGFVVIIFFFEHSVYRWLGGNFRVWPRDAIANMPSGQTPVQQLLALLANSTSRAILLHSCMPAGLLLALGLLGMCSPLWIRWCMVLLFPGIICYLLSILPYGIHSPIQQSLYAWRLFVLTPTGIVALGLFFATLVSLCDGYLRRRVANA